MIHYIPVIIIMIITTGPEFYPTQVPSIPLAVPLVCVTLLCLSLFVELIVSPTSLHAKLAALKTTLMETCRYVPKTKYVEH